MLTHLGIDRYTNDAYPDNFIRECISLARRTAYSLLGAGFHGTGGQSPEVCRTIYMVFVIPRLLYGLDAITIIITPQIKMIKIFNRKMLKCLQSLPGRVSTASIHLLMAIPPIEAL